MTPFHFASQEGHYDVCKYIIENTDEKSPKNEIGATPLSPAVVNGHLEICKLILENTEEKNPARDCGCTPLNDAVNAGHFEIFKCIAETLWNKNPKNNGITLLHQVSTEGKFEFVKYLINNVDEKKSS